MQTVLSLLMILLAVGRVDAKNHSQENNMQSEPVAVVVEEAYVQEEPVTASPNNTTEAVEGVSSKDVEVSPVNSENMPSSDSAPIMQEVDVQEDVSLD